MTQEWSKFDERGLARYVNGKVVREIRLPENRADLMQAPDGRRQLVAAIYRALSDQNPSIRYAIEKYHPSDSLQPIRTPKEILEKPGEGTCLDLSLLFCSLCLGSDLLPLLIILEGHALAAVSLNHTLPEWDAITRQHLTGNDLLTDIQQLQELIDSGQYIAIECTGFAETQSLPESSPEGKDRIRGFLSFERAVVAGREQLERTDNLRFAIDIATAHYKWCITPLDGQLIHSDLQVAQDLSDANQTLSPFGQFNSSTHPPDSRALELVVCVVTSKLERLSSALSQERAKQLEEFRELYRQGQLDAARTCLNGLRQDADWDVFDRSLQAQILQAMAGYALAIDQDIETARSLAAEACEIDPQIDPTILNTLIIYHIGGAEEALDQMAPPKNIDSFNLQIGFLLELRRSEEVITKLQSLPGAIVPDAETNRIHALALMEQRRLTEAQIKIQQAEYQKPSWEKIQIAAAIIDYNNALSPALPSYTLDIPHPVYWLFIKQDSESLQRLRNAATRFEQLASQTQRGEVYRRYWQDWYLAIGVKLRHQPKCQGIEPPCVGGVGAQL